MLCSRSPLLANTLFLETGQAVLFSLLKVEVIIGRFLIPQADGFVSDCPFVLPADSGRPRTELKGARSSCCQAVYLNVLWSHN